MMAVFSRHAVLEWDGEVPGGTGRVMAGSGAFTVGAIFPSIGGDPTGTSTPEELLTASHATCYGIGLRSLIARRGGRARRVSVTATVTAEKGPHGIRLQSSRLTGIVEGLEGIDQSQLHQLARETEERCTISIAIRGAVEVSSEVRIHA
jgi:osmotically inducible protein OsmC